MGILISHGTNLGGLGEGLASGFALGQNIRQNRERAAYMKAQQVRQEREEQRREQEHASGMQTADFNLESGRTRLRAFEQDQNYQQSERERTARQRRETGEAQGVRFQGQAGVRTYPPPEGGVGPQVEIPEGLPRDLWPDYFETQRQLNATEDTEARASIIQDAHKRWSGFVHLRGIDEVLKEMSHDVDTGAFQADSESAPDPRESEMLDQLQGSMDALSSYREEVARSPDAFDPAHIERIRKEFNGLKSKLADLDAFKAERDAAVMQIDEMAGKWTGSPRMQQQFGRLRARTLRNVGTPEENMREADKLMREPDLYGEGRPISEAPPDVQRIIRKEALQAAKEVLGGGEDWRYMTAAQRSSELARAQREWAGVIAEQYGWLPDGAGGVDASDSTGPRMMERFSQPMAEESAGQAGTATQAPGAAKPLSLEELTQQYRNAGLDETWAPYFAKASADGASVQEIQAMLARLRSTGNAWGTPPEEKKKASLRAKNRVRSTGPEEAEQRWGPPQSNEE